MVPLAALALGAFAPSAQAQDRPANATTPATYRSVLDCRTLSDPAERLGCFDKAVHALAAATDARDVVVIDRATIRETKRGLFGLTLPSIKLFGGNDEEEVTEITGKIASVSDTRDGTSIFVLEDGARWKQTDGRYTFPKPGQGIVIRRAALGSYMARVNDRPAIRVMRLPN